MQLDELKPTQTYYVRLAIYFRSPLCAITLHVYTHKSDFFKEAVLMAPTAISESAEFTFLTAE